MKQFLSIILLISIGCQIFSTSLLVAGFEINQKYIAAKLCENKNKPKMNCNGHCQLKKKLNEEKKNETTIPSNSKVSIEVMYCNDLENSAFYNATLLEIVNTYYNAMLPAAIAESVFQPPCC